jgi:hypothetical protein
MTLFVSMKINMELIRAILSIGSEKANMNLQATVGCIYGPDKHVTLYTLHFVGFLSLAALGCDAI